MAQQRGLVARLLRPFAEVRTEEVGGAVMMALAAFLLLTGYYLLNKKRAENIEKGGQPGPVGELAGAVAA